MTTRSASQSLDFINLEKLTNEPHSTRGFFVSRFFAAPLLRVFSLNFGFLSKRQFAGTDNLLKAE